MLVLRLVTCPSYIFLNCAASSFFSEEHVPRQALTMGVGTIFRAKKIVLMAWGEEKAAVVKEAVEGDITHLVPATYLQHHQNAEVRHVVDPYGFFSTIIYIYLRFKILILVLL